MGEASVLNKDWVGSVWRRLTRKAGSQPGGPAELCDRILAEDPAGSVKPAIQLAELYRRMDAAQKRAFFVMLATDYGADLADIDAAIAAYQADRSAASVNTLHHAAEPRRQQILRRLNAAPGGTALLVSMRQDALALARDVPDFQAMDDDFTHLFGSWFNAGFLVMRELDWRASGAVLNRLIQYEAVHEIGSWDELRARLEPEDRRCYAFFHPNMPEDPLIFVEVALTQGAPERIGEVLATDRTVVPPRAANTAVFYSISNCQTGLRGISFGGLLIKQVAEAVGRELPNVKEFVTLSPVPGFARWLSSARGDVLSSLSPEDRTVLELLDQPGWPADAVAAGRLQPVVLRLAARFLSGADRGRVTDPVGRFHLGNGARLERVNWLGNPGPRGLKESHGIMVNYRYDLDRLEQNHRAFAETGRGAVASSVARLAAEAKPRNRSRSNDGELKVLAG